MLKGCEKRVIVMKHPKSDLFEEAYFILKEEGEKRSPALLLDEAKRLAEGEHDGQGKKKHLQIPMRDTFFFILGILVTATAGLLILSL